MFDTTPANSTLISDITFANIQDDATTSAPPNPNSVLSRVPGGTRVISKPNDPILCVIANKKRGEVSHETSLVRTLPPVNGKYHCPFQACGRQYDNRQRLTVHIRRFHTKTARVGRLFILSMRWVVGRFVLFVQFCGKYSFLSVQLPELYISWLSLTENYSLHLCNNL